jgi:hypothetical protein
MNRAEIAFDLMIKPNRSGSMRSVIKPDFRSVFAE